MVDCQFNRMSFCKRVKCGRYNSVIIFEMTVDGWLILQSASCVCVLVGLSSYVNSLVAWLVKDCQQRLNLGIQFLRKYSCHKTLSLMCSISIV